MPTSWLGIVEGWSATGLGDRLLVVLVASIVHAVSLWVPCALFCIVERLGLWERWRLPRARPDLGSTTKHNVAINATAFTEQVVGTFVLVPGIVWLVYPAIDAALPVSTPHPPFGETMRHLLGMVLGCDTMFYWVHRALHHPLLYIHIHKRHHEFKATTIWASEYFSVVDMVMNIAPGVVPALLMGSHFTVLMEFTAIRGWQTVQSHAGYDLPFDICNRGPFWGGAKRHDFHHSHNHGCYGDWSPFWDWAMGTDAAFWAFWAKKAPHPPTEKKKP